MKTTSLHLKSQGKDEFPTWPKRCTLSNRCRRPFSMLRACASHVHILYISIHIHIVYAYMYIYAVQARGDKGRSMNAGENAGPCLEQGAWERGRLQGNQWERDSSTEVVLKVYTAALKHRAPTCRYIYIYIHIHKCMYM